MTARHHGSKRGSAHQEPLYDTEVPTPSHEERARTLVEGVGTASLCTLAREPEGYPYGSFVTFALAGSRPVFLISKLAEHTRNLEADPRCSLLVAEPGTGDPLARGRVTLVGACALLTDETERSEAREAFLAAHPNASYYADFTDFGLWRLSVESIRYIGGYGRMSWLAVDAWSTAQADPIAPAAARIIAHMNDDHAKTMALYCRAFTRATDAEQAQMTGVDRYGFEMSVQTKDGPRPIRLAFKAPVATAKEVRKELVSLAEAARAVIGT